MWLFLIGQVVSGAAVYAAIRADLREALVRVALLQERVARLESARS